MNGWSLFLMRNTPSCESDVILREAERFFEDWLNGSYVAIDQRLRLVAFCQCVS